MTDLYLRNQKIINAIIEKARRICPDSLALIGIYGSFMTGATYEKSDLDLMIVINDDQGWRLSAGVIQDDLEVGHDIYCTTWESLENDARYQHPNLSKLLDSKIVYCSDDKHLERLESLRQEARERMTSPLSHEDYQNAEKSLKDAEHHYLLAMTAETISDLRFQAGHVIYQIENAIALLNKTYFRRGTRRAYEELTAMPLRPATLCEQIEAIVSAATPEQTKDALTSLVQAVVRTFRQTNATLTNEKSPATADSLRGTYEEMFSNWRNKMYLAAELQDKHLAFLCMNSLAAMLFEIEADVAIDLYDVMSDYNPDDLLATARAYDAILERYLQEYRKVDLEIEHYPDIDAFIKKYLA